MVLGSLILMRILYKAGLIRSARINHPLFSKADDMLTRLENRITQIITPHKSN